jgi:putative nucleotidyltransferase with HDIG domain
MKEKTLERLRELEAKVKDLYKQKNPKRDDWADWLADNHVFVVADFATDLARKHNANEELARAAALLHDIADIRMARKSEQHEEESLSIARTLMQETGYTDEEVKLVVDDAIRYHSCHGDEHPESVEGKILSTADSMAHLKTDFYVYAAWAFGYDHRTLEVIKAWALRKIERDLNNKMFFDEVRQELLPDYDRIKELFSR